MKKKNFKNLSLEKNVISNFSSYEVTGGGTCESICECPWHTQIACGEQFM